jgi:hypothetical protein
MGLEVERLCLFTERISQARILPQQRIPEAGENGSSLQRE